MRNAPKILMLLLCLAAIQACGKKGDLKPPQTSEKPAKGVSS